MGNGDLRRSGGSNVRTLIWNNKTLKLIDQRRLPFKEIYINCKTSEEAGIAIKDMVVRGAPAIGVTAGYGVALAAIEFKGKDKLAFINHLKSGIGMLSKTRPTAINLFWALDRMNKLINKNSNLAINQIRKLIIREAENIEEEDLQINYRLSENGKSIFTNSRKKLKILTHCNAGALATSGYGTALGVIRSLNCADKVKNVIVNETRPYLQGARLTAWELYQEKIPFFVITDNMSGYFMSEGEVDIVIVGADRIAANGDCANKIGTMSISIMAKYFDIPFYIAAPLSTIDMKTKNGSEIPIEQRCEDEVRKVSGKTIIPEYIPVRNPAFDVTQNQNITAIITEKGIIYPPFKENIKKIFKH
ncbi:MAG: S-methyl-5-thioribose-1-phosphate isomerase [Actinobacteria bacterium]|nr:S-methyl-5-thioribose-1-phosphate isomerase [Actinomycetota bacterium]